MALHEHQHGHDRTHQHDHAHGTAGTHGDETGLADLLDLDAEVLGSWLDEVTAWAAEHAPDAVGTVVDVGAGTGTGSLALARRFPSAQVIALDRSASMLERVRAAAVRHGLTSRLRIVQADVDAAWPAIGSVDVAWAASSLHEVADPDRVLADLHAALRPGGLLVAVEMDALPRFLPDDLGLGRPGLEARCHQALAQAGWNAHPDWQPSLERAGFGVVARRASTAAAGTGEATPAPRSTGRYAQAYLRRIRSSLDGRLATDDLDTLDQLLADDGPQSLSRREDLVVRSSRTAWAARRP